jgi:hypothetical protein
METLPILNALIWYVCGSAARPFRQHPVNERGDECISAIRVK